MEDGPTPYPDVNATLRDLVSVVRVALGQSFVGAYLYGSLAIGDFNPLTSDIDLIVVTDRDVSAPVLAALRRVHTRFHQSRSPWASRLEAAYIPTRALHIDVPPTDLFPQVEKDRPLGLYPIESGWTIQLFTLREHGLVVAGRHPRDLIAPIARDDVRQASAAHAVIWAQQARDDSEWLIWVRRREHQVFVVLTLCRMLYSLYTGSVTSKPSAARWMSETVGSGCAELVGRAVAKHQGNEVVSDHEVEETIALVDFVAQEYRQWVSSHGNHP